MKTSLLSVVISLIVMIAFVVFSGIFGGIIGFISAWLTSGLIYMFTIVVSDLLIIEIKMAYVALKGYWTQSVLTLKVWWMLLKEKIRDLFENTQSVELILLNESSPI